jgi:chromosome segregation ATPase
MHKEITENRKETRKLKGKRSRLKEEINEKQNQHSTLSAETTQLWQNIGENNKEILASNHRIDMLYQDLTSFKTDYASRQTSKRLLVHRRGDLKTRNEKFKNTLSELQQSHTDLKEVQNEQKTQLKNLHKSLERRSLQK